MSDLTPFVSASLTVNPACDPDAFLLVRENFNYLGSPGVNTTFWDEEVILAGNYTPNTVQVTYPLVADLGIAAPPSGNIRVANYAYKNGGVSGNAPLTLQKNIADIEELYVRWSAYYTAGFIWPEGQKLVRVGNTTGNGGSNNVEVRSYAAGVSPDQAITNNNYYSGVAMWDSNTNIGAYPAISAAAWHLHEFYFKKGSAPSVADGRSILIIDGTIIVDRPDVPTHTDNTYPYNYFRIGLNNDWSGGGPGSYSAVPQNQNRYWDEIEMFSALPCNVVLP